MDVPKSNCVYDSIEDVPIQSSSLSRTCTVRIGTKATKSRKLKLNHVKVPDRLEEAKITRKGDFVDVKFRPGTLVNYGSHLKQAIAECAGDHSVFSGSTTASHKKFAGQGTMAISDFKELVKQATSPAGPVSGSSSRKGDEIIKFETPALDFIKDRIHEDFSHTIEYQIKKKALPAPDIAHNRPTALTSQVSSTPGPGAYQPHEIDRPHTPQILINPPRVTMDESKGDIVPLKERLRRSRQQLAMESVISQCQKKTTLISLDAESSGKPSKTSSKLNPPKLFLRSSLSNDELPVSFGTSSPRFAGVVYHTESYVKTSGMILGPDFDKKMEEKYRLGPKFGKGKARGEESNKDIYLDPPDVMRWLSMTSEAERSPIKYSAAFRPPSPKMSLKERLKRSVSPTVMRRSRSNSPSGPLGFGASHTISGTLDDMGNVIKNELTGGPTVDDDDDAILGDGSHLGPGAFFPNCAPPSIEIRNPNKPSIPFMLPKKTRSRLAGEKEAAEKAKLEAMEEERKKIDEELLEKRLRRERLRSMSLLPLVRKRK